jgi:cytoskeleton protein RodZ
MPNALNSRSRRDGVTPLGDQLRAERERRGAALDRVSEATKIRKSYLEALEGHDWKALPADVFTRGYVRIYAEYLGLDQEHLIKVYARERRIAGIDDPSTGERATRALLEKLARTHGMETRRIGTKTKWIVLGLSGGGVAALAVWIFLSVGAPAPTAEKLPAPSAAPVQAGLSSVSHLKVGEFGVGVATPAPIAELPAPPAAAPAPAPIAEQLPAPPVEPPGQTEPSGASHLRVGEFGVGTDVVDHRLVGQGDRFREGTVVWFWTSVLGGRPGDKIRHVWLHGGQPVAVAELNVNGANWRTQSRRSLPEGSTGDWTVEARDPEGHVIASVGFTCVPAE